MYKVKFKY